MADNQLQTIVAESGLEATKAQAILAEFTDHFEMASAWERKAKEIVVTDGSQVDAIALAREGRLLLRSKRIAIERTRKELKEQALREGKAIDGIANVLKAVIVPIEEYLASQENFVELKAKSEADEREQVFQENEQKRLADEAEAKRVEDEKIRLENERLKKEVDERNERLKKRERERMIENRKQNIEKERIKKEGDNRVAAEKAKAEAEKKKADGEREAERKVAEAKQAKLQADAKAREDKLLKERAEQRRVEAEARQKDEAERQRLEAELAAQVECPECGHRFTPEGRG